VYKILHGTYKIVNESDIVKIFFLMKFVVDRKNTIFLRDLEPSKIIRHP